MEVTDKLHSTLAVQHTNLEQRVEEMLKSFDEEFTNLLNVANVRNALE